MDEFVLANRIEAGVWIVMGLGFAVTAIRQAGLLRVRCVQAAVTLCAFGVSDLVEAHTGAWWKPWWLLVWKGLCVLVLVVLSVDHWRRVRREKSGG
ncbi:MAG: hypothetical protein KA383_05000 [Phycisphaerae bacterium]|jgi:hypothetical protein|nr:hypothetical protein [Phycisphaerae bacterium]